MMIQKKICSLIALSVCIINSSYLSFEANSLSFSNARCSTDWIIDSLSIQIGISNCFNNLNKYELIVVAKDYYQDTIQTKYYEIGEISHIDVIDKLGSVQRRFILKDGVVAIPVKSFNGLKICFVDLNSKRENKKLYKEVVWTDKSLVYYTESSTFYAEYETRASRNYRYKEFLWKGDSISLAKQW